jgi:hypothetical protein
VAKRGAAARASPEFAEVEEVAGCRVIAVGDLEVEAMLR